MTQPEVDVESLRLLVAVSDFGSIGAAARTVGLSQPAASARLRALEARWRLTLVERSPRGTCLTVDGSAVVSWSRRVLHEVDMLRAGLAALSVERRAGLAIAASLTVAEFLLPRWVGELHALAPDIQPHLRVVNSELVLDLVRKGDVDLGFIETAALPRDLAVRSLGSDRLVIVTAPEHEWARRSTPVPREQLAAAEFVLRESGSGTRSTFERAIRAQPRIALEADSTTALIGAALAGVGPAVVSRRAVASYVETGRLAEVPHNLDLRRPISAVWKTDRRFNEHATRLMRVAEAAVSRESN